MLTGEFMWEVTIVGNMQPWARPPCEAEQATYGIFTRGADDDRIPQSCEVWSLQPFSGWKVQDEPPGGKKRLGVTVTPKGQWRSRGGVIRESPSLDWTRENRPQILVLGKNRVVLSHEEAKAHYLRSHRTVKGEITWNIIRMQGIKFPNIL